MSSIYEIITSIKKLHIQDVEVFEKFIRYCLNISGNSKHTKMKFYRKILLIYRSYIYGTKV